MSVIKIKSGEWMKEVHISEEGNRLFLKFGFDRKIMDEIKAMEGARWHGYDDTPRKEWSVLNTKRNLFQLTYLQFPGSKDPRNPYHWYERPIIQWNPSRPVYGHQRQLICHGLTYRHVIWAAEMGTGKTLAAIELIEASGFDDCFWIGPKSALYSVKLEFIKWRSKVMPQFFTYEELKKVLEQWPSGKKPPRILIVDECSRCKNPTAQRTQAVRHLADSIRETHNYESYIVLMSGTPAPKSPADWWSQAEIACPGFIREGNLDKFKKRLAVITEEQSITGGVYPKLQTWRDDPNKCDKCGQIREHDNHDALMYRNEPFYHDFMPSRNEVEFLCKRLAGLVTVKFKKDCLDLPAKIYKTIFCKPSQSTLNVAKALSNSAPSTVKALILLRELSDGFQYVQEENGETLCPLCHGSKKCKLPDEEQLVDCTHCSGEGYVPRYSKEAQQVPCPKDDVLTDLLDEHDEIGRIVIYAGFTGSIDRCGQICEREKWTVIRADGRGWWSNILERPPTGMIQAFQDEKETHPRIAFVGHPGAAGMGLTLTASPTIVYYSNDFSFEARAQSEDRIHRPGMSSTLGATIIDLVHLPTDSLVIDNLKKKKRLQDLSLGQFRDAIEEERPSDA